MEELPTASHVAFVEPEGEYKHTQSNKNWRKYMNERYLPIGLLKLRLADLNGTLGG